MKTRVQIALALLVCLPIVAAGCGATSPTVPSATAPLTGAVIAGSVTGGVGASTRPFDAAAQASSPFAGLVVRVVGSSLSSVVTAAGTFEITGVPAGPVRLQFKSDTIDAMTDVSNVTADQFVQIRVQVTGASAVILEDARSPKITLCHAEGTGNYHLIDISLDAESAHRAHGDAKVGEAVPGQPGKTFDSACRPVGPSVDLEKSTNGEDADVAPGPRVTVGSPVTWRYTVTNDGTLNLTSVAVVDDRGVVVNCGGQTTLAPGASISCTGTGIATAVGQYRNVGSVTARWASGGSSGTVTDSDPSHYLGISPIEIEKLTNGEDADVAPGPSILVGSPVTWEYRLSNIGTVTLTGISVVDDRGVSVNCAGQTTLAAGASMTCTGTGVAVAGQYRNIGTVTAQWAAGAMSGTVTASDPSHYRGITPDEQDGPKVQLCHRTGAGFYVSIDVSVSAEPAHRAHGDGKVGEAVPGSPGRVFGTGCIVR